jgi:hypothetical protein
MTRFQALGITKTAFRRYRKVTGESYMTALRKMGG